MSTIGEVLSLLIGWHITVFLLMGFFFEKFAWVVGRDVNASQFSFEDSDIASLFAHF